MGTKVHHSMRDLNQDSNGFRWPLYYGDNSNNTSPNDQCFNGFPSQSSFGYDKDVVRRTMLEQDAVFQTQVLELHRVYRVQKEMMDDLKRKQLNKELVPNEASCSSQANNDDARKWKMPSFPLANSVYDRPSMSVVEDNGHSPILGSNSQGFGGPVPWQNGASSKHVELSEVRPTKIRKQMIDLCLPAEEYVDDSDEVVELKNHIGSSLASHQPRQLHPYNPPDSAVPWNHSHSSRQNHSFGFPQNVASAQRYPVLNPSDTLSGNAQKQGYLGDRLQSESNSRFNSGCGSSSRLNHNMFYSEGSSSSKPKFPENGYSYPNGGRSDYISASPFMNSNGSEMKSVRDLNLNVTFSNTSVAEVRKDKEQHLATLPWLLKPKPTDRNWNLNINDAVPSSSLKPLDIRDEAGSKDQNLMWMERLKSGSCTNKPDAGQSSVNLKVPAFGYSADKGKGKVHNVRMLDMNAPGDTLSDEDQETEEQSGTKVSGSNRCPIDLNMSVSEDEDKNWSVPTSSRRNLKAHMMIDLEAPAAPESEDEEVDDEISGEKSAEENTLEIGPEFEKIAAETMVAISSACLNRELEVGSSAKASENVILHWFAETVDTHRENLERKLETSSRNQARSIEEIDDFEAMTLQLPEMTEDEYMPKPLVPEDLKLEETSGTAALVTSQRPRRGNARKGKQRRDFQRDILPGLLSLSKHEVTEDIHMFDGFMRAAGSSWTPTGLSRKKTGARGRPRRAVTIPEPVYCPAPAPVQQYVSNQNNNGEIEMGLEDRRFADWGKMTRRPRRQRCPAPATANNQRCSSSHASLT